MPLPKPKSGEKHDDFINRCMSDPVMVSDYDDTDQRLAVCESQWDKGRDATKVTLERRVLATEEMELRIEGDGQPRLVGYAAKFGKWSEDLGGFREKIKSGAFDAAMEESDVRCLKNHDKNLILGRSSSGTLRLGTNTVGLQFDVDLPDTTTGRDTREEVRRGDITGCSFAFTVAEEDWKYLEDGRIERTILKIDRLFDVGPVTYPAYPDTTVAARSLDDFKARHAPGETVESPQDKNDGSPDTISAARQRDINYSYQEMGRLIRHVEQKTQSPES